MKKNNNLINLKDIVLILFIFLGVGLTASEANGFNLKSTLSSSSSSSSIKIDKPLLAENYIFFENFEGSHSWSSSAGWELTNLNAYSQQNSFLSIPLEGNHNLISPEISLPEVIGDDLIQYSFWVRADIPDSDGNDDGFLDDYYSVSVMDVDGLSWHTTVTGTKDGSNVYWVGDEDEGGYLNSWAQYLDSPVISISENTVMTVDMKWSIEGPEGADSEFDNCIDGWDQALVMISIDQGISYSAIEGSLPYDFQCGYGADWNGVGMLPGWGGSQDWTNISFDLSDYSGQEAIIRFAFFSDAAYSTPDDPTITGIYIDNINIGNSFSDNADDLSSMIASGEVWIDQFYDYGSITDGRPGSSQWEQYIPGSPFSEGANLLLDLTDLAGKKIKFKFQSRYDNNDDGGTGEGLFVDDFGIFIASSASHPPPENLYSTAYDQRIDLAWKDMNQGGVDYYIYDNNEFLDDEGYPAGAINLNQESTAFAASSFNIGGDSNVDRVDIFNINPSGTVIKIFGYESIGEIFSSSPTYESKFVAEVGWNTIYVNNWTFKNKFLLGYEFSNLTSAVLDVTSTPSYNSYVLLDGSWESWQSASGSDLPDGEWGIRAVVTSTGSNVLYNVYQDDIMIKSGLIESYCTVDGLINNQAYEFAVSAYYSDEVESELSQPISAIPQPATYHELSNDDNSFEASFVIGSSNTLLTKFSANPNIPEKLTRFKWYQTTEAGALKIKIFSDNNGEPLNEIFSEVVAGGLSIGWNEKDLSEENIELSGEFWIGIEGFSSTSPIAMDATQSTKYLYRLQESSNWEEIEGSAALRAILDGQGADCNGQWGGTAIEDLCGVCDPCGDGSSECDAWNNCSGCTDQLALNYVEGSAIDDGSCQYSLWPGDVDNDCKVTVDDILPIIVYWKLSGPNRSEVSYQWAENVISLEGWLDAFHARSDANGDGIVNINDILAILINWNKQIDSCQSNGAFQIPFEFEKELFSENAYEIYHSLDSANSVSSSIKEYINAIYSFEASPSLKSALVGAYPNPFNGSTSIEYEVVSTVDVDIAIYNIQGVKVEGWSYRKQAPGIYTQSWSAGGIPSGIYFVLFNAGGNTEKEKVILIK
ncbi:MAG: hypothetical protein CBD58_04845 [bacterium TMED198]|nr:MAG: hypothetical protein CBD58_04845 [bacterium TMED198]